MILPAMGVISEVITCFARRKVFGYTFMVYAMVAIAGVSFFVWGHHMFVSGMSPYAGLVFSLLSFVVAVPSAIKVFNWTGTLSAAQITFQAPMLYALGFLGLFTIGGLTGLFLASIPIDIHVHDTYFVIAHFHYIMVGGSVSAFYAGAAFLVAKNHRQDVPGILGAFCSHHDVFRLQLHVLSAIHPGLSRMPRRYHMYPPEFQALNVMSSSGAACWRRRICCRSLYLTWSLFTSERAEQSLEGDRARMADDFAAPDGKLPHSACRR